MTAQEFEKIINEGRERKKNQKLANDIFLKDRRKSAPGQLRPGTGLSLASRVSAGVRKRPPITFKRRASFSAGNASDEWTHDMHHTVSGKQATRGDFLRSRVTRQSTAAPLSRMALTKRNARVTAAFDPTETQNRVNSQVLESQGSPGLTIRGLAGPFVVLGQNFAPGTTPADVETAMTPIGGEMVSCKLLKSQPSVIMEMVFASREGGERVIEKFNNKTADGRVIKVYPKIGGHGRSQISSNNTPPASAPTGPRASRDIDRGQIIDGSLGFPSGDFTAAPRSSSAGLWNQRLYSDAVIANNKRGRGFQRAGRR